MKLKHVMQHDERDCGAACLSMILKYYGSNIPISVLRDIIKVDAAGSNIYGIVKGSEKLGLTAEALEGEWDEFVQGINDGEIVFPLITRIVNEYGFEHFVVVSKMKKNYLYISDPARTGMVKVPFETFKEQWQGQIITFSLNDKFKHENLEKGSLSKYFKFITRQKKMLSYVFVMSIIVMLINISGAFIFQYILDDALEVNNDNDYADVYVMDENGNLVPEDESEHEHEHEGVFLQTIEKIEDKLLVVFKNINTVCITMIGMYLLNTFLIIIRGNILVETTKRVDIPLTMSYYEHMVGLPISFFGTRKTGELMSRFEDTSKIRDMISSSTLTILLDTLLALVGAVILLSINVKLFFITSVILLLYSIIVVLFRKPIRNTNYQLMEYNAQVTSYLKESIDGIETIKTSNYESESISSIKKIYNKFANKAVSASKLSIRQDALISGVESIGIVILLWVGTRLCLNGVLELSELFMFYYLINYFLSPMKNLINLQPEMQTAIVAASRLNDIMDVKLEDNVKQEFNVKIDNIEISDVEYRYGYRELTLKNISMKFEAGKSTAIVGETGCGKTTLIKLLMAFDFPETGAIKFNIEKNIYDFSAESIRKKISYVPQNIFLFSDTIFNNLKMGNNSLTDDDIFAVCRLCEIDEFISSLPLGYNTMIEENGNNLSSGQKQRIAIARAILRKPDVLILDEATCNLDTVTEKSIQKTIDKLSVDMICIIIAHRLSTIKNCDYIYVMDNGCVVEEGTHNNLLKLNGTYSKLYLNN